jgi:hypothetical protein
MRAFAQQALYTSALYKCIKQALYITYFNIVSPQRPPSTQRFLSRSLPAVCVAGFPANILDSCPALKHNGRVTFERFIGEVNGKE